jgi:hypothetical protein
MSWDVVDLAERPSIVSRDTVSRGSLEGRKVGYADPGSMAMVAPRCDTIDGHSVTCKCSSVAHDWVAGIIRMAYP